MRMNDFTFSDFEKLSKEEADLQRLIDKYKANKMKSPTKKSVDTVLAFSKALSVRKSQEIDFVEHLLN